MSDANKIIEHEIDYRYYLKSEKEDMPQNEIEWIPTTKAQSLDKRFEVIFSNYSLVDYEMNPVQFAQSDKEF